MKFEFIEGKTSAELRDAFMKRRAVPAAKTVFANDAEANSLLVVVSQYWSDEAVDAVHNEFLISPDLDPDWPLPEAGNPFYDETTDDPEDLQFYELSERGKRAFGRKQGEFTLSLPLLDSNTTAITAFASYCKTGMHQELVLAETGSVYAIIRRADSVEPSVEIVGEMIQPGWEDRFDVGFQVEGSGDALFEQRQAGDFSADAGSPEEALARRRLEKAQETFVKGRSWWRRLLGR